MLNKYLHMDAVFTYSTGKIVFAYIMRDTNADILPIARTTMFNIRVNNVHAIR